MVHLKQKVGLGISTNPAVLASEVISNLDVMAELGRHEGPLTGGRLPKLDTSRHRIDEGVEGLGVQDHIGSFAAIATRADVLKGVCLIRDRNGGNRHPDLFHELVQEVLLNERRGLDGFSD